MQLDLYLLELKFNLLLVILTLIKLGGELIIMWRE